MPIPFPYRGPSPVSRTRLKACFALSISSSGSFCLFPVHTNASKVRGYVYTCRACRKLLRLGFFAWSRWLAVDVLTDLYCIAKLSKSVVVVGCRKQPALRNNSQNAHTYTHTHPLSSASYRYQGFLMRWMALQPDLVATYLLRS